MNPYDLNDVARMRDKRRSEREARRDLQRQIERLDHQVMQLRVALVTTLVWMSGSSVSPLRHDEIKRLIALAEGESA